MRYKYSAHILTFFALAACSWIGVYAYTDETLLKLLQQKYESDYRPKFQALKDIQITAKKTNDLPTQRAVKKVKTILVYTNLRAISLEKLKTSSGELIANYRKSFLRLKKNDLKAERTWSYLENLEKRIKSQRLSLTSGAYKSYLYVLSYVTKNGKVSVAAAKNKELKAITSALRLTEDIENSTGFLSNLVDYRILAEDVLAMEGFPRYSHSAFNAIREKIIAEKISSASQYFQGFKYLAWVHKKLANQTDYVLSANLSHSLQLYSLSCEANSATDFINFYREKEGSGTVKENDILNLLPQYAFGPTLEKTASGSKIIVWANPFTTFVGSVVGKQSSNPSIFTGYGVYAPVIAPIIRSQLPANKTVSVGVFDTRKIESSLLSRNPVMVWYLKGRKDKAGKESYNFSPIIWNTVDGQTVKGYIGEHTALIVGLQTNALGETIGFYFYE